VGALREHPPCVAVRVNPASARLDWLEPCCSHRKEALPARSVYPWPQGYKEPSLSMGSRIEAARPTGFFRDALAPMPALLSFFTPRPAKQPGGAAQVDVDGHRH